jgi:hypothetical protein
VAVDLIERTNYVILKELRRLKNLPFNLNAPYNVCSRVTSLEDPSRRLTLPSG